MRASFLKSDRPRPIDRYIDFFGGAASIVAGLAVAGCAGLIPLSDQGGTRAPAAAGADAAPRRARGTAAAGLPASAPGPVFFVGPEAGGAGGRVGLPRPR